MENGEVKLLQKEVAKLRKEVQQLRLKVAGQEKAIYRFNKIANGIKRIVSLHSDVQSV